MNNSTQTILVIDDDPLIVDIIGVLIDDTAQIIKANTGAEGIALAKAETPDLILLDVRLPDKDGYKICQLLKEMTETKDIPVIFITALGDVQNESTGLEMGAIDYIIKPIEPQIVKARIRNHLTMKRQRDLLANMSMIDGLTGIANRRRFDVYFNQEWRRSNRAKHPLSVMMVDIDFFKLFNDTYGHQEGDRILKSVAEEIDRHLNRPADLVSRYGGEEFVVVLPETDLEPAVDRAQQIRMGVENLAIPHDGSDIADCLTVSIGVATYYPPDEGTPEQLIAAADEQLYASKDGSRNNVHGRKL